MLILVALLTFLFWYCWRIYAPYSKFRNYFWMDWEFISRIVIGKGPQNIPLMSFLFQKCVATCRRYETEGMCVIWLTEPMLFVYGEEAVKFFSNEPTLHNKPNIYRHFDFFGESVDLMSSGENSRKLLRLISPSFAMSTLKAIVPVMNSHAAALVEELAHLKGNVTEEIDEIISARTLRLFFETTLAIKGDTAEKGKKIERFIKVMSELVQFAAYKIFRPWLQLSIVRHFSSSAKKHLKLSEEIRNITEEVLDEIFETIRSRNQFLKSPQADSTFDAPQYKSLGEDAIEEHMKDPSVTMDTLRDHLISILFGGFHTVTHSLEWCLWLLGLYEDVQERAYEELMSVTVGDVVQYDDARKMTYLECIIKESMRLYPIAPIFARCSHEDVHFGDHTVPKDTTVVFFSYLSHRNPNIYPDPEAFKPDRFAETDSKIKLKTFMPFAEGVRSCIGKNFAMLEMKIVLAHVLQNFKIISLDRREDVVPTWEIVLKSATPLRMQFVPR